MENEVTEKRRIDRDDEAADQPRAKRSRVTRACDQCRVGREKCDGTKPQCATCIFQKRDCTYIEQPRKRGIQPNYIRALELTLAWAFSTFPDCESVLINQLAGSEGHAYRVLKAPDAAATESMHKAWRECLVNRQIEQLLSDTPVDRQGKKIADGRLCDGNPTPTPHLHHLSTPQPTDLANIVPNTVDVSYATPSIEPTALPLHQTTWQAANQKIKLPKNAFTLLEYYFAFTHSWLPIMEKYTNLKLVYSYPRDGLELEAMMGTEHVELWSIMAVAASQTLNADEQDECERLRNVVNDLIPTGDAKYKVGHVKALLLLGLIDIQRDRMLAAWIHIGFATRIITMMRLLQDLDTPAIWWDHVVLAAFVLENALALRLNAPAHLTPPYIKTFGLVREEGMDEWEPWCDPLTDGQIASTAKPPARSLSTINRLVRTYVRCSERTPNTDERLIDANDVECSIVFSLVRNASLKAGRLQPSVMVSAVLGNDELENTLPAMANPGAPRIFDWLEPSTVPMDTSTQPNAMTTPASLQYPQRPSIGNLPPNSTHDAVNFYQPGQASQMELNIAHTSPAQASAHHLDTGDGSTIAGDVFEEFDALLERHDTENRPQFMQNLGFAAELDLAAFFGADYQPADPLLAYMHTMMTGSGGSKEREASSGRICPE